MPSVLIVDDEPNIRRMVGALLSSEGYDVRDAPDGAEGMARAAESEPDVALRLERIEQAIDAIAVEVERISEGQRFTTKLLAERVPAQPGAIAGPQDR